MNDLTGRMLLRIIFLGVWASLISAAAPQPAKLVKLTAINKGALPLGLRMQDIENDSFYYLRIPGGGSKEHPVERIFTIRPGSYSLMVDYIEYYDPVYGFQCAPSAMSMNITSNTRVVFLPCGQTLPNAGEPTMVKFGFFRRLRFRY